ncbi:hypothetical protein FB451DRAFT_1171089 [Mycena latifolia]|nr:hypothetical protein FB451DRAFT_1171089 [Mycena latifolia]
MKDIWVQGASETQIFYMTSQSASIFPEDSENHTPKPIGGMVVELETKRLLLHLEGGGGGGGGTATRPHSACRNVFLNENINYGVESYPNDIGDDLKDVDTKSIASGLYKQPPDSSLSVSFYFAALMRELMLRNNDNVECQEWVSYLIHHETAMKNCHVYEAEVNTVRGDRARLKTAKTRGPEPSGCDSNVAETQHPETERDCVAINLSSGEQEEHGRRIDLSPSMAIIYSGLQLVRTAAQIKPVMKVEHGCTLADDYRVRPLTVVELRCRARDWRETEKKESGKSTCGQRETKW